MPEICYLTYFSFSDESEITSVQAAGVEDVDIAVAAARKAFKSWKEVSGSERGDLLLKLSALTKEHAETLATIDTWDNGKPYNDSLTIDLAETIEVFKYYGGWADKVYGQVIDTSPAKFAYTLKEPIGVCGQIIPWKSVPAFLFFLGFR